MKVNFGPFPKDDADRVMEIQVDPYDTWNLDHTLAVIIAASLKTFMVHGHGAPFVANDDVPEHLHRSADTTLNSWETDECWFSRWDWVLNEMHFAFDHMSMDKEFDTPEEVQKRVDNGIQLFAKYFRNLWN